MVYTQNRDPSSKESIMSISTFFNNIINPQPTNQHNIVKDFLRLVRDVLAIASDFLHLELLDNCVNYLNEILGDDRKGLFDFSK